MQGSQVLQKFSTWDFLFQSPRGWFPWAKCQGLSPNWRISSWQGVLLPEIEFNNWTGWNQFIRKNSCETWVLSSALLSAAWLMLGKLLLLPCPPFIWKWKGFETKQDPVGLLVMGTLLCSPPPTSCSQGLASSLQDLPWVPKGSFEQLLIREERRCKEKGGAITIYLNFFAELRLPTNGRCLTVWITTNCGKFLKRWKYQTTWPASQEICMQVKKQQLKRHGTTDWFQIGKGVH